jgi:hypothetical protein
MDLAPVFKDYIDLSVARGHRAPLHFGAIFEAQIVAQPLSHRELISRSRT